MQRPDVFLRRANRFTVKSPTLWAKNSLGNKRPRVVQSCSLERNLCSWKSQQEEQELRTLKEKLMKIKQKNEQELKHQVKLINQLKQKNLEYYYYSRELKREKRLHYLLQLECRTGVNAVYGQLRDRRTSWVLPIFSFANLLIWRVAARFLHRWTDFILKWSLWSTRYAPFH